MAQTKIEWTERTWNPTTGCTKISAGCTNCYAEKMAYRLKAMGSEKYKNGFALSTHPEVLDQPYTWKPSIVFVNSMSDLFHEDLSFNFIKNVFDVMNDNPQHQFQVLTKRAEIAYEFSNQYQINDNIWLGVTIENRDVLHRLDYIKKSDVKIKFISFEPLLENIPNLNLNGINWVIVGGESGSNARMIEKSWVINIKNNCRDYHIPFFFKQWGGYNKKKNGRKLNGKIYEEFPKIINSF